MTTEIKQKIEVLEKAISSSATPDNFKPGIKNTLAKLQKELEEAEEKENAEEKEKSEKKQAKEEAEKAKKEERKKARKEKDKKQKKERASKKIVVDGKEISKSDADYLEKLFEAWQTRRAEALAKKAKTKSVFNTLHID